MLEETQGRYFAVAAPLRAGETRPVCFARTQLLAISARSIDRLLQPVRAQSTRHGPCGTKPGTVLKNQIRNCLASAKRRLLLTVENFWERGLGCERAGFLEGRGGGPN